MVGAVVEVGLCFGAIAEIEQLSQRTVGQWVVVAGWGYLVGVDLMRWIEIGWGAADGIGGGFCYCWLWLVIHSRRPIRPDPGVGIDYSFLMDEWLGLLVGGWWGISGFGLGRGGFGFEDGNLNVDWDGGWISRGKDELWQWGQGVWRESNGECDFNT